MRKYKYATAYIKINGEILEYDEIFHPMSYSIVEEDARQLFAKTKELLDEAGIQFALVYGSLLGAVRNGTTIPGDGDLDIFTADEEKLRNNIALFREKGLKLGRALPGQVYTFYLADYCFNCYIDVYILHELQGIMSLPWRSSCFVICEWETPRRLLTGYREIEFLGYKVLCPENPESLLEFWYGSDWMIPQNKKGTYRVKSANLLHIWSFMKPYMIRSTYRLRNFVVKPLKLIFDKHYREQVLLRREKTGSYFYKNK